MIRNQNLNKATQCRGKVAKFCETCVSLKSASAHAQLFITQKQQYPPPHLYLLTVLRLIRYKQLCFCETLLHHFTHSCSAGSLHSDSSQISAKFLFCSLQKTALFLCVWFFFLPFLSWTIAALPISPQSIICVGHYAICHLSDYTLSSVFTSGGLKELGRGTWSTMIGPFQLVVFVNLCRQVFHSEDISDPLHADVRGFVGLLRELRKAKEAMREVVHYTQSHRLLNVPEPSGEHYGVV